MKRGAGWGLIMLMVATLLFAWFTISQMGALHHTTTTDNETEQSVGPVEQAQDADDAINETQEQAARQIEE